MMWASVVVKRFNQIESIEFIGICFLAYGQNPLFFYAWVNARCEWLKR
jgi:hypothetical protein